MAYTRTTTAGTTMRPAAFSEFRRDFRESEPGEGREEDVLDVFEGRRAGDIGAAAQMEVEGEGGGEGGEEDVGEDGLEGESCTTCGADGEVGFVDLVAVGVGCFFEGWGKVTAVVVVDFVGSEVQGFAAFG